jgi:hypothetical protein
MSAAATAAGYLYASGRLRGRNSREEHDQPGERHGRGERAERPERKEINVEVYAPELDAQKPARPAKTPKIQYRVRRWRPSEPDHE